MEKIEERMEDYGMQAREGSEGSEPAQFFLRDHIEKKT
jgi:hypothetical protein